MSDLITVRDVVVAHCCERGLLHHTVTDTCHTYYKAIVVDNATYFVNVLFFEDHLWCKDIFDKQEDLEYQNPGFFEIIDAFLNNGILASNNIAMLPTKTWFNIL